MFSTAPIEVAMANASVRSVNTAIKKSKDNRHMLDQWKWYLDSWATYHSFSNKIFLTNVKDGDTPLIISGSASTTVTNTRGWWGEFEAWLDEQGITNLLSVPMLESH